MNLDRYFIPALETTKSVRGDRVVVYDKNHQKKIHRKLSDFKEIKLDSSTISQFKSKAHMMKYIHPDGSIVDDDYFGPSKVISVGWIDKSVNPPRLVSCASIYTFKSKIKMLSAFEITPYYRGSGLSEQILKHLMDKYGVNELNVLKENRVAIDLYKKLGFKIVQIWEGSGDFRMALHGQDLR